MFDTVIRAKIFALRINFLKKFQGLFSKQDIKLEYFLPLLPAHVSSSLYYFESVGEMG